MRQTALGMLTSIALLSGMPAHAQSILELPAGVQFCKTLKDDARRLKCYDGLSEEMKQPQAAEPPPKWSIKESKSPVDDSPQVDATLIVDQRMLVLRCRERKTEVIFGGQFAPFFGSDPVKVLVRINDEKATTTTWFPSTDGQAAFAPAAVQFIRALPDHSKLFIRGFGSQGSRVDGTFELGSVSAIRDKIAAACKWGAPAPHAARSNSKPRE